MKISCLSVECNLVNCRSMCRHADELTVPLLKIPVPRGKRQGKARWSMLLFAVNSLAGSCERVILALTLNRDEGAVDEDMGGAGTLAAVVGAESSSSVA